MSENGYLCKSFAFTIGRVNQDRNAQYKALCARDPRFDGTFFVGVTSTGIYCRPICPAKTPKRANCAFFNGAHEAEQDGYRPCLRCRPELAPGNAPVDDSQRIAQLIVQRLEDGAFGDGAGVEAIAAQFELSARQIRRIVQKELGVSPIQLLQTRRLLLAKQLLTETSLPITQIAFASGFASLRRFNHAFSARYRMPPGHLRNKVETGRVTEANDVTSTLQVSYRPPYDWKGTLAFLAARELKGVEWVTDEFYARTVCLNGHKGWIRVTQAKQRRNSLLLEFTHSLTPVLPTLLNRVRDLFDVNARPDIISGHLSRDSHLAPLVRKTPGLRVPGAFNGFELGLGAILGQQISVKSATTIACRLARSFGESISTPFPELDRLTPARSRIANASVADISKLGIVNSRAASIITLAKSQVLDEPLLEGSARHNLPEAIEHLTRLPGIGQWTAHYIAMRALGWPDAFPSSDIAILRNLGGVTSIQAEELSQAWRPWRSYAVLHIWRNPPQ